MGGAFSSIADDATALFWNPAGIARIGHLEITGAHANLFDSRSERQFRRLRAAAVAPARGGDRLVPLGLRRPRAGLRRNDRPALAVLKADVLLDGLRGEPRYAELIRKMGLPPG
jgi:hypothetical protein